MSSVSEHWTIRAYNEDNGTHGEVVNSSDEGDHRIDMKLSFFRGPNYVKYMTRDCDPTILRHMTENYEFDIVFFADNTTAPALKLALSLKNITWNVGRQRFEFLFVPYLHLFLDKELEIAYIGDTTVIQILQDVFYDNAIAEEKITTVDKIYHDFCFKGTRSELLAYIAKDLGLEYYTGAGAIVIDKSVIYADNPVWYPQMHVNSLSTLKKTIGGVKQIETKIHSAGISGPCVMPGFIIDLNGVKCRVVYLHTTYKRSRGIETTVIGANGFITEEEFADILPLEDRSYLMEKINSRSYSDIGLGSVDKDDGLRQELLTINTSHDTSNLLFLDKATTNILTVAEKVTPFGGSIKDKNGHLLGSYGIQYPAITASNTKKLLFFPEGRRDMALSFGTIWQQDELPKRDSIEDYRFTFPDGTTIYQRHDTGEYIISSTEEITIEVNQYIASSLLPQDDQYNARIRITANGIVLEGENPDTEFTAIEILDTGIVLQKGTRTITMTNSVVDVT